MAGSTREDDTRSALEIRSDIFRAPAAEPDPKPEATPYVVYDNRNDDTVLYRNPARMKTPPPLFIQPEERCYSIIPLKFRMMNAKHKNIENIELDLYKY